MKINNKTFIYGVSIFVFIMFIVALYGFHEKNTKLQLYKDFRENKKVICGDTVVQKAMGWKISNNRFFTNGTLIKTIAFCESID